MPSGRDVGAGRRGGSTTKKNAFCSFCRKSYRDVGPLVEGPGDVYICGECIELCQSILEQERRRRGTSKQLFTKISTPREIVAQLDDYVIGKVRAGLYKQEPDASASLTKFQELHAKGDLNDAEFRTIKALLAERLQHDLNDTDEAS